jgi:peroxiredoxin
MKHSTQVMVLRNLLMLAWLSLSLTTSVTAQQVDKALLSNLTTFNGKAIVLDKEKITHLVFIDLWRSYEGKGDEQVIADLPDKFLQQSQQLWLQPEVNVTKAQLAEFQQYFPKVTPLILDKQFALMRGFKVWQSPFHVLVKGNQKLFSGDNKMLLGFIAKRYPMSVNTTSITNTSSSELEENNINTLENGQVASDVLSNKGSKPLKPNKPIIGDKAPQFSATTLTGKKVTLADALMKLNNRKPLNLIFIDALCPMPHFPDCEAKLAQVNELIKADESRQWLGVVNSYYVNEEFAQQFAERFALTLPLLFDQENTIYRAYDVYASPYLIKINHQGIIESRSDILN